MTDKTKRILESRRLTKLKRKTQICKTYEVKINFNYLNEKQKEHLKMYFVEAKWLYNYILSLKDSFNFDYKTILIKVKDKEGNLVDKQLSI